MFEIGSEFWIEERSYGSGLKSLVPNEKDTIYTLSGRTALDIVIEDILLHRPARSVYMPSYCCHTMIEPFLRNRVEIEYYDVSFSEKGIKCYFEANDSDLVFLIDFFGFIDKEIREYAKREKGKGKVIIYDATHAVFCENQDYSLFDYVFGSFRKWTGINAGFASKQGTWIKKLTFNNNMEFEKLRKNAFEMKAEFIRNPDMYKKELFLTQFQKAEELLETDYRHYSPDFRSKELLETLNVEVIRDKRRRNAKVLMHGIETCKRVVLPYKTINTDECPLFVPIVIRNGRDTIRKYLIDHSIYFPVHWPISSNHRLTMETRTIYEQEMSCVCDQRYDVSDMEHIVKVIKQYY